MALSHDQENSSSIGVELLGDIREIFANRCLDKISCADLIQFLCEDEENPWATYNRGRAIKPRQVTHRLKEFGITSSTLRFGSMTAKGYLKSQFTDAFQRYLPAGQILTNTSV